MSSFFIGGATAGGGDDGGGLGLSVAVFATGVGWRFGADTDFELGLPASLAAGVAADDTDFATADAPVSFSVVVTGGSNALGAAAMIGALGGAVGNVSWAEKERRYAQIP